MLVRHAQATIKESSRRNVAEQITRALIARDMRPVLPMFPAAAAADLADDVRLGAVADRLSALGDLHDVRFAGPGTLPDTQRFIATFSHGTVGEEVSFEGSHVIGFSLLPSTLSSN
jgi:hypothetical protein